MALGDGKRLSTENIVFYDKFPVLLREALKKGEVFFPEGIEIDYVPFPAFRMVFREEGDNTPVSRNDFCSYAELGKKPRGMDIDNIGRYSASLYRTRQSVVNALKLPRPGKKLIEGLVYSKGGPCYKGGNEHVDWWLYEETKEVTGFVIIDAEGESENEEVLHI